MFTKQTIEDIDLSGKTVWLRADYNVPLKDGVIEDDYRMQQSLPTLHYLLDHDVRLVIGSHLGRPKSSEDSSVSLAPVATHLSELLGRPVGFASDCIGESAKAAAAALKPGEVVLLENLRYHPEEEANDPGFAKQLATVSGADVFVQDGFGVVHRAHASTEGITHYLPAVAGLLLAKEVDTITDLMQNPKQPLMAVLGGAKIEEKIEIVNKFVEKAQFVAIVGAMANIFLLAEGQEVGKSLCDPDKVDLAQQIMEQAATEAAKREFELLLPTDVVVAQEIKADATSKVKLVGDVAADDIILDIGPATTKAIVEKLEKSQQVAINGTAGMSDLAAPNGGTGPFAQGTLEVLTAASKVQSSFIGGGDSAAAAEQFGLTAAFSFVSTGGGASLELMGGHDLPGVVALLDK